MRRVLILAAAALLVTGCTGSSAPQTTIGIPTEPAPTTSTSTTPDAVADFSLTSPDFADGDELADWATASEPNGRCTGDNLSPALEWFGAPDGTAAFAITMRDESAGGYVHWAHGDIPPDVTSVERGGSIELAGVAAQNQGSTQRYYGPCPPNADHKYVFTVYALDAPLGLEEGAKFADFYVALTEHELASATIAGLRSGPAS